MFRFARILVCAALCAGLLPAQVKLTVEQIFTFIRSSIQLKHEDRRVADYLKKVQLSQRLDERTIEELQGMGAGPRTVEALRALAAGSSGLPAPAPAVAKPEAAPAIPPPSAEEQERVLGEARDYALNYTRRLPDFLCVQVTRRYIDPSGLEFWQRQDVITERLSYSDGHEKYDVILINGQPVTHIKHEQLGGATSSGEFGSMLKEIFEPETGTEFGWERWATLRKRRMHVYAYRVPQSRSKYRITYANRDSIITGYRGLLYIDRDTNQVMRILLQAENLPPSFPIQQVALDLNYDYTDISGQKFLLPLKAELRSREGRLLVRNEVEFRMYRKFGTETSITFEPEPIPEEATKEQPPAPAPPPVKKKQ